MRKFGNMEIFKRILVCFAIFFIPIQALSDDLKWPVGEELTYKVRWSIFRLGTLRLKVDDTLRIHDDLVYHVRFIIDSNPLLFFVNHHSVFESYFSDHFNGYLFRFSEKIDGIPYDAEYRFDYSDSLIVVELKNGRDSTNQIQKNIPFDKTVYDGTALLYYLRSHAGEMKTDTIQYLSTDNIEKAVIRFNHRLHPVSVSSLNKTLSCYYLDGRIFTKTVADLTGYFQAWISADRQHVPITARLKVFIGYVTIELEEWKMWQPL
jgi:hypothetical protein